ncbi:LPXTG cell wall anchor domain-containing protein [Catellatospora chokoriensis]|uniref:Gram-positive cocci surface proteins LPxTG domain-containing protein n=1 Tax=Catellatospora chokoriensis TaxID=310353 RepID=A0A8J3NUA8_9ACTN|nr:LPXTG cell wall anchor domain-containing protein [Catellatospora chokoriensis]GIF92546.1 hypothetical protein Cch02nite_59900 [Catellatospora chokoriensis]
MKRPIFRRLLAVTGSVALGLMGAVALGSPAQAHHPELEPVAICATDGWTINWTIENSETQWEGKITKITPSPTGSLTGGTLAVGKTLPKKNKGSLTAVQKVGLDVKKVSLYVEVLWEKQPGTRDDVTESRTVSTDLKLSDCALGISVTGSASCDNVTGKWNVKWAVTNQSLVDTTAFVITTGGDTTAVRYGTTWQKLANESDIVGLKDKDPIGAGKTREATQVVPGNASGARLKVKLESATDWNKKEVYATEVLEFSEACVKKVAKPEALFASTCDVVTVNLTNDAAATKNAEFTITGANGFSKTVSVEPGKSTTVEVPKESATGIKVTAAGMPDRTYSWADSADCHPIGVKVDSTCLNLKITLDNPANGKQTTIVLTPTKGDAVTKTLAPGTVETVDFPLGEESSLSVEVTIDGKKWDTVSWATPRGCETVEGEVVSTCTGLTFNIVNPEDGSPAEIVLDPSNGDAVKFTLQPTEKATKEFTATGDTLSVDITVNGVKLKTETWQKPEKCNAPSPSPSPSAPPTLPKTGTNVTIFVISGLLLVAVGFAVFMLARRRRLNMTEV